MRKLNWLGVLVVHAGVIILLDNTGVIDNIIPGGVSVWQIVLPALLIGLGVSSMAQGRKPTFFGSLLSLGGLYWLLINLHVLSPLSWSVIIPVVVILLGLSIIFPGGRRPHPVQQGTAGDSGFVKSTAVFSGDNRRFNEPLFTGASITAVFGGSELDFSGFGQTVEGAVIDVQIAFGGCELRLPYGVIAKRKGVTCLFGGIDEKGLPVQNAPKTVYITGSIIFGGLDIIYPYVAPQQEANS
jgi:hypothetical protein